SKSADDFLSRLGHADYDVRDEDERVIRRCIAARQNGTLAENEGRSARTFLSSWRYALDHFDLTREIFEQTPVHTRVDDMQSDSFAELTANGRNLWIFSSNINDFVSFE